jgi:hypothetical protein
MDFSAASPRPPLHSANSSLQTPKSGAKATSRHRAFWRTILVHDGKTRQLRWLPEFQQEHSKERPAADIACAFMSPRPRSNWQSASDGGNSYPHAEPQHDGCVVDAKGMGVPAP